MKSKALTIILTIFLSLIFTGCPDSTVSDSNLLPVNRASRLSFTDMDRNPGELGGSISIGKADDESDLTGYYLYWGIDSRIKGGLIAEIQKTGSDLTFSISENTAISPGVGFFLVFSNNDAGEMDIPVSMEIEDIAFFSVFEIQDLSSPDHPEENTNVEIDEVIVTAIKGNDSFWVQEPEINGYPYSGIFIYNPGVNIGSLTVGNTITIKGEYKEYFGLSEISLEELVIVNSGTSTITPLVVDPANVATGGINAEKYEGVLVKIETVAVIDANPEDPLDENEFMVTDHLRIDDELYLIDPDPVVDDTFTSITGILTYTYTSSASGSHSKLLPRSESDVVK